MKTDCYKEVMEMITKFTVTSLRVSENKNDSFSFSNTRKEF